MQPEASSCPSEQLRLNLSVPVTDQPNRLGVLAGDLQGFPNGRRLADDVVDIELQALVGAAQTGKIVDALAAGDKVDANDQDFSDDFPYVALPNGVAVNSSAGGNAGPAAGNADPDTDPGTGDMDGGDTDGGDTDGGVQPPADDSGDESPDPSLSPAGFAGDRGTLSSGVGLSAVGVATLSALVALFLIGWRRRWWQQATMRYGRGVALAGGPQ